MLDLIDISKSYGDKCLLDGVSFSVKAGEKIAIIGKNGAGKSTLLKLLAGKISPDDGKINLISGRKLAMLGQEIDFKLDISLNDFLKKELSSLYEALNRFKSLQSELESFPDDKNKLKELESLINFLDHKDAWSLDQKISRVLKSFDLEHLQNSSLLELSGGELRRVQISQMVLQAADLILLDEPTNHLDVYMSEFLVELLAKLKSCVIFISHDRYFIDALAKRCLEVEDGKVASFSGGYSAYLAKKLEILKSLEKSHESLLKNLKSEEEWLRRGVRARLKRNEGRKERLMQLREQAKKNPGLINKMKVQLNRAGNKQNPLHKNKQKMLFELDNLSKTIGSKTLFKDFSTRILQGEKIAIVGKNGCGKSTFLKILLGDVLPDSGVIKHNELKIGYFDQKRELLDDAKTITEIFCPNGGDRVMVRGKNMHIFGYLKLFLFPKELLSSPVSLLSGGEKNRLALALLFTKHYDLLILDEPTNDLDINTINILEEYLQDYKGALLFVSHDRYFCDKIAHKLYAFERGKIGIYHTLYDDYLACEKDRFEVIEQIKKDSTQKIIKAKSAKLAYKDQEILSKHPDLIKACEDKISNLTLALGDASKYQEIGIQSLHEQLLAEQTLLERLEDEYFASLEKEELLKK